MLLLMPRYSFMGRLGWVVGLSWPYNGLGNGPNVLGNGQHVLDNGPPLLGNGPHLCTQFINRVILIEMIKQWVS